MTVRFTACSNCGKRIRRGRRRFGPAQVRCGHCQEIMNTGLDQWASFSAGRKITLAVEELLFPSWIGTQGCDALFVIPLVQVFLWTMAGFPLTMIAASLDPRLSSPFAVGLFCSGSLVYPALLAFRLWRMIRESDASTRTGAIPVWK